jgi:hypothetical protein
MIALQQALGDSGRSALLHWSNGGGAALHSDWRPVSQYLRSTGGIDSSYGLRNVCSPEAARDPTMVVLVLVRKRNATAYSIVFYKYVGASRAKG